MPARKLSPTVRADVALAREHAQAAVARLVHWMKADDARVSLAATTALLDRAFGKPGHVEEGDGDATQAYSIIKRVIIDRAANQDG